jgi:uncharacterized membrane protein
MATADHGHEQGGTEAPAAAHHVPEDGGRERGRQLDRVNAFSDGVFSIAATLLVLSIDVPNGSNTALPQELRDLERPVFSYFLSFAVVGIFWFHHHRMLGRLRASDTGFATMNLAFLAFVAFLPAPTELLGRYDNETVPVVVYALNVLIIATLSNRLSAYADRNHLTDRPGPGADAPWLARWSTFIAFGVSIPIAFVAPHEATYFWLLAAILPALDGGIRRRRRRPPAVAP